jgi:hypothetical protein
MTMSTVPSVHEHVHAHAKDQRQPYEGAEDMSAVFGPQQRAGDDKEAEQNEPDFPRQHSSARLPIVICVVGE